jgi:putative phosphoesterase
MAKVTGDSLPGANRGRTAPAAAGRTRSTQESERTLALIGDVHANLQALEAVLADIDRRGIRRIFNVGDLVGFGASPQEVVDLLRKRGVESLLGNIDERVLIVGPSKQSRDPQKRLKQHTLHWTHRQLRPESRRYLRSLPRQIRVDVGGRRVLLVHGSPESIDEYLDENAEDSRLKEFSRTWKADAIVAGHSHRPMVKKVGGTLFVNTGSVGRPAAGGSRSCYAILTARGRSLEVRHVFPPYDMDAAVVAIRAEGLPETYARMIVTGCGFKDVGKAEEQAGKDLPAKEVLRRVRAFARQCHYERGHCVCVTGLALSLFDQLRETHRLGERHRLLLECAGILHDVGLAKGPKAHHKESMRMILLARDLGLCKGEQEIVANIARYHRKTMPTARHDEYRRLASSDQKTVRTLAGLLKFADSLDRQHRRLVRAVQCRLTTRRLVVRCRASGDIGPEIQASQEKKDLLEKVLGRAVETRRL